MSFGDTPLSLSIKWEHLDLWIYDIYSAWGPAPGASLEIANTILPWEAERFPFLEVFIVAEICI